MPCIGYKRMINKQTNKNTNDKDVIVGVGGGGGATGYAFCYCYGLILAHVVHGNIVLLCNEYIHVIHSIIG